MATVRFQKLIDFIKVKDRLPEYGESAWKALNDARNGRYRHDHATLDASWPGWQTTRRHKAPVSVNTLIVYVKKHNKLPAISKSTKAGAALKKARQGLFHRWHNLLDKECPGWRNGKIVINKSNESFTDVASKCMKYIEKPAQSKVEHRTIKLSDGSCWTGPVTIYK